jgi:biopolymer transport protein TolQ
MGLEGIPVFLQIADSFYELVSHAGTLAKSILIILLVLSVVSWTVMVEKYRFFTRASNESKRFLSLFKGERTLEGLADSAEKLPESPEAKLVSSVYTEIKNGELENLSYLDRFLESKMIAIISEWESYLIFLATTATVSPFLGLLGTVWGIMSSFLSMGARGSANLYVVGPGIAEALITTIFGLGAAIPAVIGYNYIIRVIRRKEDQLSSFSARFRSRILERRYVELGKISGEPIRNEDLVKRP